MSEWISAEERMPTDGQRCLVWNGHMHIATFHCGRGVYFSDSVGILILKVTHWMPLPEPPDKEKL